MKTDGNKELVRGGTIGAASPDRIEESWMGSGSLSVTPGPGVDDGSTPGNGSFVVGTPLADEAVSSSWNSGTGCGPTPRAVPGLLVKMLVIPTAESSARSSPLTTTSDVAARPTPGPGDAPCDASAGVADPDPGLLLVSTEVGC